jgi:hypothetical protein
MFLSKALSRRRLTAPLLVLALVLAQITPQLWRMDCLLSGRTVLSLGNAEACMPELPQSSDHAEVNTQCCDFTVVGGDGFFTTLDEALGPLINLAMLPLVQFDGHIRQPLCAPLAVARTRPPPNRLGLPILHRSLLV